MSLRILIVEDEQIIADDLREKVNRLGHSVLATVMTGEEAVEVAARERPDLVFMDIQLASNMKGTEAAKTIQERIGARIIFITAFPRAYLRERPELRDPGLCLTKPISRVQLEAALRTVMESA